MRFLPLFLLFSGFILFYYFHGYEYLTLSTLSKYQTYLHTWTSAHYPLAVLIFVVGFILAVAISIPGVTVLSMLAGFLFGYVGFIYVLFSATVGCIVVFITVRFALSDWISKKAGYWLKTISARFQKNDFTYVLMLRLMPIFPYWLVNISAPLFGVRLRTFVTATIIGIMPVEFIAILLGKGLGQILSDEKNFQWIKLVNLEFGGSFLGFIILILIPVIYKYKQKKTHKS